MNWAVRQNRTDSPKAEVGEIDTRAPFASVKAAVSLFGEVAFSSDKSSPKKAKTPYTERTLAKESQLHLIQKELKRLKEHLSSAETTRTEALSELKRAKKQVEELTDKLNSINESKEHALKATEDAKTRTSKLEERSSTDGTVTDISWKQELDNAREQYGLVVTKLEIAKEELRKIKKDFEASVDAKTSAAHQEMEANDSLHSNTQKAAQLSKEIAAAQESLTQVKLAFEQAQQEETKIISDKGARRQSYKQALEETQKKVASLKKEHDSELNASLEAKLAERIADIGTTRKEIEDAKASESELITNVTEELDEAKEVLQKVAEEESSLRSLVESLKLELQTVRKEHNELKEKDAETESTVGSLHVKLRKAKADLEAAMAAEAKATSASNELVSGLQQLSLESENAIQYAEMLKTTAGELRSEADATKLALQEAEKNLQFALREVQEAKAAEAKALDQIKDLSEKANASRASTSESGTKITVSREEYDSLSRKVEESDKLAEMKVAAALAQVDAVKASENESIKRLEALQKEMEDVEKATEEALKRAEMAETAKKVVEGELRRWREREQKRSAETAALILAESQQAPVEASPSRQQTRKLNFATYSEGEQNASSLPAPKKTLLPSLSGIFSRRKHQVEEGCIIGNGKGKYRLVTDGAGSVRFLIGNRQSGISILTKDEELET